LEDGQPIEEIRELNGLNWSGVPNHTLTLKENCLVMLLRNLSVKDGLMNGTKLIVRKVKNRVVICDTIDANRRQVAIPRMNFEFFVHKQGQTVRRRQFPLRVCYAMTINKSQGKTLDRACIDLTRDPFEHGQLYVALGRVRDKGSVRLLLDDSKLIHGHPTSINVVRREIIQQRRGNQ